MGKIFFNFPTNSHLFSNFFFQNFFKFVHTFLKFSQNFFFIFLTSIYKFSKKFSKLFPTFPKIYDSIFQTFSNIFTRLFFSQFSQIFSKILSKFFSKFSTGTFSQNLSNVYSIIFLNFQTFFHKILKLFKIYLSKFHLSKFKIFLKIQFSFGLFQIRKIQARRRAKMATEAATGSNSSAASEPPPTAATATVATATATPAPNGPSRGRTVPNVCSSIRPPDTLGSLRRPALGPAIRSGGQRGGQAENLVVGRHGEQ